MRSKSSWAAAAVVVLHLSGPPLAAAQVDGRQTSLLRPRASTLLASTEGRALQPSALQQVISVDLEDVPLEAALRQIAERAGMRLTYSADNLPPGKRVSLRADRIGAAAAMRAVLGGTELDVIVSPAGDLTVAPVLFPLRGTATVRSTPPGSAAFVQATTVTGRVVNASTGAPLTGVMVTVVGTARGGTTDAAGAYSISEVPPGRRELRAQYVGYAGQSLTVEVVAGQATTADFSLTPQAIQLEGVVAVGYGDQRRGDVTGSIGVVDRDQLENVPLTSPDQALVGQIAGVSVTMPTGLPGGAPQIQVRGVGAVGAGNQPLFVVDGFALPQPDNQAEARLQNPLSSIPTDDIESITVLKDASATAIYGSRASNGVVIITTKSGRAGPRQVQVSAYSGVQNEIGWMRPKMANARQFATWQNIRYQDMVQRGVVKEVPEPYRNPQAYGEGTDWFGLVSRPAYLYNVQASVSGGSPTVRSFFSGGFQQQQGIVPGTDFTRLSLRANVDATLSSWLQAGLRLAPSYTRRNQPGVQEGRGSATGIPMLACPLAEPYDAEGNLLPYIDSSEACPGVWTFVNPLYLLENTQDERNRLGALTSSYLKFDLGRGLTANTTLNAEWVQGERKYFSPSTIGADNRPPPSVPSGAYAGNTDLNWLSETTLNLASDVGPGRLDALAGITFQRQGNYDATFNGIFPDDDIRTLNVASNLVGSSNEESWSLLSYLARVNYSLLDRFVFTGTMRLDGSSRFGVQNRWGSFPSGAVAWNVHNEDFMAGLGSVVPELRLRVSYGRTGNNQIGNYSSLGVVQRDDYMYGGAIAGGRRVVSLGNEQLGWERTNEWNAGLDLGLFGHRVRTTIDAYNRMTTDLLVRRSLPTSSGFATVTDNGGTVRNRGVEVSVSSQNVSRDNFSWSTDVTWALNRNRVISLPGGEPIFSGGWGGQPTHMTAEGLPLGVFIGMVRDGIYQNEEEIAQGPKDPGVVPGNIRWRDVNGDGAITVGVAPGGDYGVIGNPHPDFTFGITNSVTLGRFDFRANVTGRKGGDVLRFGYYQSAMNVEGVFNVAAEYVENMWLADRKGTMPTPLGSREAIRRFHIQHDGVVASGSNLWLRNVMLRYNLPDDFAGLSLAGIYVSAQNPLVFTAFRGNPEVQSNQAAGTLTLGMENFAYPVARQLTLGVDLRF